ncbi:hypothetical protein DFP72DRAFT_554613 [Ephemerocybe angulata]|uniref:Uncharacterized protein n=1 Tax=Ephemerocybe angulata TaxID=980116 RepID=A0A8H6HMC4_9AGAR|nr:hypothetical protein DFP72DRAFT_554613 [Tulosesus angulatus]
MVEALGRFWRHWGQRTQLLSFLILGSGFAVGHHFMCHSLGGKPIREGGITLYGKMIVSDQTLISAGSNALAQLVKYCFAATVGVSFTQYFWNVVEPFASKARVSRSSLPASARSKKQELEAIDAPVAAAGGNPFLPSSYMTWVVSPGLAAIAVIMLLLVLIPTFAPGSIRVVSSDYGVSASCPIYTPNISMAHMSGVFDGPLPASAASVITSSRNGLSGSPSDGLGRYTGAASGQTAQQFADSLPPIRRQTTAGDHIIKPSIRTTAIVNNVIISGSYLRVPSPCGMCTYNVSFIGASLKCSSDSTYDYTKFQSPAAGMSLFSGSFDTTASSALTVAIRDGNYSAPNPPRAVNCDAYSTLYDVQVWHNATSWVELHKVTVGDKIDPGSEDPTTIQLNGLVQAVGQALNGSIGFKSDVEVLDPALTIAYSPLLRWTRGDQNQSQFVWSDMEASLPSLMQNVSFSLLSGQFLPRNGTYFTASWGMCMTTQLVYEYTMWRLLTIYGAGWVASVASLVIGFWHVSRNGRERDLEFSKLVEGLDIIPHEHEKK